MSPSISSTDLRPAFRPSSILLRSDGDSLPALTLNSLIWLPAPRPDDEGWTERIAVATVTRVSMRFKISGTAIPVTLFSAEVVAEFQQARLFCPLCRSTPDSRD